MKVAVPGKLILSGEHAVVYGHPAIAMAVNRYVTATITRELLPHITFDLSNLAHEGPLSVSALRSLKARIKNKYHQFIQGKFSIREVLMKPFELAQFAFGLAIESLNVKLPHGIKIHVHSNIPIGCGMGSSAATILSVMHALSKYLEVPISDEKLLSLALEAENMQHGFSSGLDLRVAMQGGCLFVDQKNIEKRVVPNVPFFLVNTGTPSSTTGECVQYVAKYFKNDVLLGQEFANTTKQLDHAMRASSIFKMHEAIQQNHLLLNRIGVVPHKVQSFIAAIHEAGGAAKVCGAGSISGDRAGAVLILMDDEQTIETLAARFEYNVISISGETRGLHEI